MAIFDNGAVMQMKHRMDTDLSVLLSTQDYAAIEHCLESIIVDLHKSIPDKKRISYGITYVVKTFSQHLFRWLDNAPLYTLDTAVMIYKKMFTFQTKCIGLGIISHIGVKDISIALPYFKDAATHELWEVREFAQMYIRKITKAHPGIVQVFLLELAKSSDPNHRRYASESLRPVVENRWINEKPEYSLKVLKELFLESNEYPRTSVGNNLSDLSRKQPELILNAVAELMSLSDENAQWIAHRACRNLIKTDPLRVMDLLGIDFYSYKGKRYKKDDYQ